MTVHVGVAGVSKAVSVIKVGVAGAWKTVSDGWVGVGGVWKKFYSTAAPPGIADVHVASFTFGTTATAQYRLNASGSITGTQGSNTLVSLGTWIPSGVGADYACRGTLLTGAVSGDVTNWQVLSSNRTWSVAAAAVDGSHDASITVEIRRVSDSVVIQTATITFQAERNG